MSKYIGYEIAPVTAAADGDTTPHEDKHAAIATGLDVFWSLYGEHAEGGVVCIGDFEGYQAASEVDHGITGHPPPENLSLRRLQHLPA